MPLSETAAQSSQFRPPSRDNPTENASGGGGVVDSDTGGEGPNTGPRKKAKKKKTTNLGPCIRVHEVKPDGAWLEVKAYFETSKNNQCVAFEFKTHDLDLDEMTATFIDSDFCTENESELVRGLMREIVDQLDKDPTKLPVVYMFPRNDAPPSPTHETAPPTIATVADPETAAAADNAASASEESPAPRPSSAGSGGSGLSRFNVRKIDDPAPPPCPPATPSDMAALPSSDPSAYEPTGGTSGGTENTPNFTPQSTVNAKGSRPDSVCATPKDGNRDHSLKTLKMKLDAVMPSATTTAVANPDQSTGTVAVAAVNPDVPQGTQSLPPSASGDQQAVPTQVEHHTAIEGQDSDDKAKEER